MKQIFFIFLILVSISCAGTKMPNSKSLLGKWDNKKGQILEFKPNGVALWIFYSETKKDTFTISYRTDFSTKPYQLDLTNFQTGMLKGKTLVGIMEFAQVNSFKFDCEPTPNNRPVIFNEKQTQTYFKVK